MSNLKRFCPTIILSIFTRVAFIEPIGKIVKKLYFCGSRERKRLSKKVFLTRFCEHIMGKLSTTIFLSFANNYSEEEDFLECLVEEENGICKALDQHRNNGVCSVYRDQSTTQEGLTNSLRDLRDEISIFHFSGHSSEEFLLLENEDGSSCQAPIEPLSDLLINQNNLHLVFLNSCRSNVLAEILIKKGIPVVIGCKEDVGQEKSRDFAIEFYKSLGSGATIKSSFEEARAAVLISEGDDSFEWKLFSYDKEFINKILLPNSEKGIETQKKPINILQISDLNYSDIISKSDQYGNKIDDLISELQTKENKIDFLFYTGNLGVIPLTKDTFFGTYSETLGKIGQALGIKDENIILTSGKRDIDSSRTISGVSEVIHSFTTNESLSSFYKPNEDFRVSCNKLEGFNLFQEERSQKANDFYSPLLTCYNREVNSVKFGIVSLNILWSEYKKAALVFPLKALMDSIEKVKSADYRILITNYPTSRLKQFCRVELEDLIYRHFDFIFLGSKTVKTDDRTSVSNEGIFSSYSGFNFVKEDVDYQIISFDPEGATIKQKLTYSYLCEDVIVQETLNGNYFLPKGDEKTKQIKLIQILYKWFVEFNTVGNDLFINYKEPQKEFVDLFTSPILRNKPIEEIQSLNKPVSHFENHFEVIKNSKENYIIFGKDKSGKSSLLIFLAISYIERFPYDKIIPFYIDLIRYNTEPKKFDLLTLIARTIQIQKGYTADLLKKYHFRLLIDNFDPSNTLVCEKLSDFLEKFNSSYVICSDQTTLRSYENFDYGFNGYQKLFIHDVTRKEIRSLVSKTIDKKSENHVEEIVQKIVTLFKQHRMPFNYWTISIFLWVISRRGNEDFEIQNNSQLIELYIQELLGQRELALQTSKAKFPFPKYKRYLSFLAHYLYKEHENSGYSASYIEIIIATNNFLQQSRRNVSSPEDIVTYILSRGVLKKVSNNLYGFRLNGVFEYFLANEMAENESFLDEIISNDTVYLTFKNEIDLFSGFERRNRKKDKDFLLKIFQKTMDACLDLNKKMEILGTKDYVLQNKARTDFFESLVAELDMDQAQPLSFDKKDQLQTVVEDSVIKQEDNFKDEVQVKKKFDSNALNHEVIETYIFIMGRVFRNIEIEGEDSKTLDIKIFTFLLNTACNWGFLLFDELLENEKMSPEEDDLIKLDENLKVPREIIRVLYSFVPLIVQDFLYNSLGHATLENIIKDKIEELERQASENQFQLFLLYFLLVDLDLKGNREYIEKAMEVARIGSIKFSISAKIIYYLFFKSQNNKSLQNFLKEKFRELQFKINPKLDTKDINRQLSEFDKMVLMNKKTDLS